jgi:hypothetical protein
MDSIGSRNQEDKPRPTPEQARLLICIIEARQCAQAAAQELGKMLESLRCDYSGRIDRHQADAIKWAIATADLALVKMLDAQDAVIASERRRDEALGAVAVFPLKAISPVGAGLS